jgi:signal peptidase I
VSTPVSPTTSGPLAWTPEFDEDDAPRPGGLPRSPASSSSPRATSTVGGWLREFPILVIATVLVAFLFRTFVFQAFFIPSPSMGCASCPVHTLEIDDKVLVSKVSYLLHEPRRGDIVVFDCPAAQVCNNRTRAGSGVGRAVSWFGEHVGVVPPSTEDYIKRVIALPGETVEIRDGFVLIDGRPLIEPYLSRTMVTTAGAQVNLPYLVPEGHLWVMGDNRGDSSDSRVFESIPKDSVVGRAIARFWPMRRWGFL